MRKLIIAALLMMASTAFAGGFMPRDSDKVKAPLFSPDGTTAALLTIASTTTDVTNSFMYSVIGTAATCKMRLMPTSAKGAYVAITVPAASYLTYAVNPATPFLNLSGCTGGYRILH